MIFSTICIEHLDTYLDFRPRLPNSDPVLPTYHPVAASPPSHCTTTDIAKLRPEQLHTIFQALGFSRTSSAVCLHLPWLKPHCHCAFLTCETASAPPRTRTHHATSKTYKSSATRSSRDIVRERRDTSGGRLEAVEGAVARLGLGVGGERRGSVQEGWKLVSSLSTSTKGCLAHCDGSRERGLPTS